MENRRFKISILFMLFVTSVFFISCGEPSFCTLNNVRVYSINESELKFEVTGNEEDLEMVTDGPGLLVFYYLSEEKNNSSAVNSFVRTQFRSLTTYGFRFSDSDNFNSFIFKGSESSGETEKKFYAFAQNASWRRVEANGYCKNLFPYFNGSKKISVTFSIKQFKDDENKEPYKFILNDGTTDTPIFSKEIKNIIDDNSKTNPQYVHVFVAFGSPVGSFSNNYWSDAEYVGTLRFKN